MEIFRFYQDAKPSLLIMLLLVPILIGLPGTPLAREYNFVSADELKGWLESDRPVLLVDIQEHAGFAAHHIKGSVKTTAYPVKSDADREKLAKTLPIAKSNTTEAVVVVCPRGKGGAKRTYEYLQDQGIDESKLVILTGGMEKWPYQEWVASE